MASVEPKFGSKFGSTRPSSQVKLMNPIQARFHFATARNSSEICKFTYESVIPFVYKACISGSEKSAVKSAVLGKIGSKFGSTNFVLDRIRSA
jgi:hypothetical protein